LAGAANAAVVEMVTKPSAVAAPVSFALKVVISISLIWIAIPGGGPEALMPNKQDTAERFLNGALCWCQIESVRC